jgi:hypothetical protein
MTKKAKTAKTKIAKLRGARKSAGVYPTASMGLHLRILSVECRCSRRRTKSPLKLRGFRLRIVFRFRQKTSDVGLRHFSEVAPCQPLVRNTYYYRHWISSDNAYSRK